MGVRLPPLPKSLGEVLELANRLRWKRSGLTAHARSERVLSAIGVFVYRLVREIVDLLGAVRLRYAPPDSITLEGNQFLGGASSSGLGIVRPAPQGGADAA